MPTLTVTPQLLGISVGELAKFSVKFESEYVDSVLISVQEQRTSSFTEADYNLGYGRVPANVEWSIEINVRPDTPAGYYWFRLQADNISLPDPPPWPPVYGGFVCQTDFYLFVDLDLPVDKKLHEHSVVEL